jgi:periplasmic divalent cation tolerance protein
MLEKTCNLYLVYTTVACLDDAEQLSKQAIAEKLAVCVNIISPIQSIYQWQGVVEQTKEYSLLFKTLIATELRSWLEKNHPYTTPAIISISAESNKDFYQYALEQQGIL